MKYNNIEHNLKEAYDNITPDVFDAILHGAQQKKGNVIIMTQNKKKRLPAALLGIAAACILLVVGTYGFNNFLSVSTISLDVNPSIELSVNRNNNIVSAQALNADGVAVLGDMKIVGSDAELAVNAIVGSMVRLGYVNDIQNSILLSVEGDNPEHDAELQQHLAGTINETLTDSNIAGSVLSQTISSNENSELASQYDITLGKAQLIDELLLQNPLYDAQELAGLSITQLNLLLQETSKIQTLGTASDNGYVGKEAALNAALANAGATEYTDMDVDLDLENGVMVYEVEFKVGNIEYDYDIDALTGAILSQQVENDDPDDILDDPDDDLDDIFDDLNDDDYDDDGYDDYDDDDYDDDDYDDDDYDDDDYDDDAEGDDD